MFKNMIAFLFLGLLLVNVCGCVPLLAGAAGGAGTAAWLSGKLVQEFNVPYDRTVTAVKSALQSLNLVLQKEAKGERVAQLRSEYTNGKDILIDVHKVTENSTKVEVRVGRISPDKEAATAILAKIQQNL